MYPLIRQLFFQFPPESVHHFSMNLLHQVNRVGLAGKLLEKTFAVQDPSLQREVFGLTFKNPVGLGAGFDKNAMYLDELAVLGFGHVEIGTVTPLPQPGNDQPRVFRLPQDKALINRMGFNNNGMKAIRGRLAVWRNTSRHKSLIIGGNIGKNKVTENEDAWKDYQRCFDELFDVVDYFVVNVSSPNTPGLRALQDKDALRKILSVLQESNHARTRQKPLLLKIAPDLTQPQLDDIIELASEVRLSGLVATNTTISREALHTDARKVESMGAGGLSGKPVQQKSTAVLQYIAQQTNGSIPLVASGGIFTGADALEKLNAGASLVQVWTGFIYEGPAIAKKICRYLVQHSHHNS